MSRDPTEPLFHWRVEGPTGPELVIALYTRPCRYGRCTFCSLPALSRGGEEVTPQDIERQVDKALQACSATELEEVAKVSIYTASSSLDQVSLPTRSLMYLVHRICDLPKLRLVSLETRPEYVEDWELKALRNVLGERVRIEVGIGYETHDPVLRNEVLVKGLTEGSIRALMGLLAENGAQLKAYVMLKPHWSLTEEAGVVEAKAGIDHLAGLSDEYRVPVSVHLNPTYMASDCALTEEMRQHGYVPPELASVVAVVRDACQRGLPIYVGLDDEGLAVEGGTFGSAGLDRERTVRALIDFNRHQDLDRLLQSIG